jgi:transcriptional regulator with XRE-family HTH domain
MSKEQNELRKILSSNIKRWRSILGITQEKLAESAGISVNMVNDIEGCRTWVSDKTLIHLAEALETEVWSLFLPHSRTHNENIAVSDSHIAHELRDIKKNFDIQFEKALKMRGF